MDPLEVLSRYPIGWHTSPMSLARESGCSVRAAKELLNDAARTPTWNHTRIGRGEQQVFEKVPATFTPTGDAAVLYSRKGWPVLPLHSLCDGICSCGAAECRSAAKHPRTRCGIKDATTDPGQIEAWWQECPDANVGIATGEVSGVLVIDVDPRSGGFESFDALEEQCKMPRCPTVLTGGGGFHKFFKFPDGGCPGVVGFLPGVDVKSNGGYVVAPPSIHSTGFPYSWSPVRGHRVHLPPVPPALLDAIRTFGTPAPACGRKITPLVGGLAEALEKPWIRARFERSTEGLQGNDLSESVVDLSLASMLASCGLDEQEIADALRDSREFHGVSTAKQSGYWLHTARKAGR